LTFGKSEYRLARNFGDHPHAIHGVGWQRPWNIVSCGDANATIELDHDASGDAASTWPWPFHATQSFTLAATSTRASLTVTMTVENIGIEPYPFGLGWHPFFPRAATTLAFSAEAVWLNDATKLPLERRAALGEWSFATPRRLASVTIDNVYCAFGGCATLSDAKRGFVTTLEADSACRWLVVYVPAQRDFMAVEPVTHETDAFNRAAREAGTGMRVLAPGESFSCTMRLSVASRSRPRVSSIALR
jgi:aldose 1-epimerase